MAATYPASGHGTAVAFTSYTEMNSLQLTDINWDGGSGTAIDTTHYGVSAEAVQEMGNMTAIASKIVDPGTWTFEYSCNTDTRIPRGATDTVTITWGNGAGTWAFTGLVLSCSGAFPKDGRMVITVTVKACSKITMVDAA